MEIEMARGEVEIWTTRTYGGYGQERTGFTEDNDAKWRLKYNKVAKTMCGENELVRRNTWMVECSRQVRCTTLYFTALLSTSIQCTPIHTAPLLLTTLNYTILHSTPLRYTPLTTLHSLHYTTLHSLHYTPLHCTALHSTAPNTIRLIHLLDSFTWWSEK